MTPLAMPENDKARLITLQILRAGLYVAAPKHPDAARAYSLAELVPVGMADDLVQTTASLEAAYGNLMRAVDARAQIAVSAGIAFTRLALCVRGIWAAMQRRMREPDLSAQEAGLYMVPPPSARRMKGPRGDWLPTAAALDRHLDELAVAGVWLPTEPSRADLQQRLAAAQAADDAVHRALAACKQAQMTMQQARRDAASLYRGLAGCVRMGLRKLLAGARRDIMRSMGFRFHNARGQAAAPAPPVPDGSTDQLGDVPADAPTRPDPTRSVGSAATPSGDPAAIPAPRRGRWGRAKPAVSRPRRARPRIVARIGGVTRPGRAVYAGRKRRPGRRRRAPARDVLPTDANP